MEKAECLDRGVTSLRITCGSLLVCSNNFRQQLTKLFDVRGIFLVKTGPQRKYFKEGVLRLNSTRGFPGSPPFEICYRGHKINFTAISEEEAESREKESHKKMYVGGIGPETSSEDIKDYFSQFGQIAFVQLISKNPYLENKKFGFVIFEHYSSLAEVYRCSPHFLHGHKLLVMDYVNNTRNRKLRTRFAKEHFSDLNSFQSGDSHFDSRQQAECERLSHSLPSQKTPLSKLKVVQRKIPTPITIIYQQEDGVIVHSDLSNIRFNIRNKRPANLQ